MKSTPFTSSLSHSAWHSKYSQGLINICWPITDIYWKSSDAEDEEEHSTLTSFCWIFLFFQGLEETSFHKPSSEIKQYPQNLTHEMIMSDKKIRKRLATVTCWPEWVSFRPQENLSAGERLKPEVSGLDQDDYIYYLLWAALSSFWVRCTEFVLSVWHADVLSLISTWDWAGPGETGGDGGGAGRDGPRHPLHFLLRSLHSFRFLISHQVPEGLCFPVIFFVMGEVVGTNSFFESVPTLKLAHNWAVSVVVSFAVSWQLHEVAVNEFYSREEACPNYTACIYKCGI